MSTSSEINRKAKWIKFKKKNTMFYVNQLELSVNSIAAHSWLLCMYPIQHGTSSCVLVIPIVSIQLKESTRPWIRTKSNSHFFIVVYLFGCRSEHGVCVFQLYVLCGYVCVFFLHFKACRSSASKLTYLWAGFSVKMTERPHKISDWKCLLSSLLCCNMHKNPLLKHRLFDVLHAFVKNTIYHIYICRVATSDK